MTLLPKPLRQALRVLPMLPPGKGADGAPMSAFCRTPVLQAPPLADELARAHAQADEQARLTAERIAARGCGWFESSFDLHQGLAVSESTDAGWAEWDAWTALALGQVVLEPSSAQLQ